VKWCIEGWRSHSYCLRSRS